MTHTRPDPAALSPDLPDAVARVARSVLAVVASRRSVGSGTVWRDRFVVAAAHRVWRAERVRVLLPDGEAAGATVRGLDTATDLALLALDDAGGGATQADRAGAADDDGRASADPAGADAAKAAGGVATDPAPPPPVARADDRAGRRAGEFVFAVSRDGSGLANASFGHVGAASDDAWRTWRGGRVDRLIRLDGGLYPGCSGAPVADAAGRAIGIATSALSRLHGIVLPWSTVDRVLEQLLALGRVRRAWLGVAVQPARLPDVQAASLGVAPGAALLVTGVADDSPAAAAGLLIGDLVLEAGGARVESIEPLRDALAPLAAGATLALRVARGGQRHDLAVQVGERAPRGRRGCGGWQP